MKLMHVCYSSKTIITLVVFLHLMVPSLAQRPSTSVKLEKANQYPLPALKSFTAPIYVQPIIDDESPVQGSDNSVQKLNHPIFIQSVTNDTSLLRYGIERHLKDIHLPRKPQGVLSSGTIIYASKFSENFLPPMLVNITGPVGTPDHYVVPNDAILSVPVPGFLGNDIDPDGEVLTATAILDSPDSGDVSAFGDGQFTFEPDPGFEGIDSFTYRMRDASLHLSDTVTVIIEVYEGNRPPSEWMMNMQPC